MELAVIDAPAPPFTRYFGAQTIDLVRGQGVKIKLTGPATDLLDVDVPAGKKWTISMSVQITETDA